MMSKPKMNRVDMGLGYSLLGAILILYVLITPACYLYSWMERKK